MRTEAEANRALELYADMVRRICFLHLKNHADVDDIFQEVFLKYVVYEGSFESDAHEKAWLIRVSINACRDTLKSFFRKKVTSLEDCGLFVNQFDRSDQKAMEIIRELPVNYRNAMYLYYIEGYKAVEIAAMLEKKENTVYSWLGRARILLKDWLENERNGN